MSEKILAVEAGHGITEKELNNLISNYPPEQQSYMSSPQAKQEVLEQLTAFHLFYKMAATSIVEEIRVSEEEERAFYQENMNLFQKEGQVSAKHFETGVIG